VVKEVRGLRDKVLMVHDLEITGTPVVVGVLAKKGMGETVVVVGAILLKVMVVTVYRTTFSDRTIGGLVVVGVMFMIMLTRPIIELDTVVKVVVVAVHLRIVVVVFNTVTVIRTV
jgi:hypothetical protein